MLEDLAEVVREEDPSMLVTYANYPSAEYLHVDNVDFLTFNVFLENRQDFRSYLTRLHTLAGDRPLVLGEIGLDAGPTADGERRQAEVLDWQLEVAAERGVAGTCVFSWTDEWWVGDSAVDGWHFGLTRADRGTPPGAGINAGVVRAHRAGVVTSTSLMVRWPAAFDAARLARDNPDLSVGLHVDLGQWSYHGGWVADYLVVDPQDDAAVAAEVERQVDSFHDLLGAAPTHLDGHQHVQRSESVRRVLVDVARTLEVPLRPHSPVAYSGVFYGQTARGEPYHQGLELDAVLDAIRSLGPGWHEFGCHPGLEDDAPGAYRVERAVETELLCDLRLRRGLDEAGIELRSFRDLAPMSSEVDDPGPGAEPDRPRRSGTTP